MCDFCKEIRKVDKDRIYEDNPFESKEDEAGKLILCEVEEKVKFYGFNKYSYDIDTIYKNVDNVNFCPVCGRKL